MTAPERRRPGGSSLIGLQPQIEDVRTPANSPAAPEVLPVPVVQAKKATKRAKDLKDLVPVEPKRGVAFKFPESLKLRIQTAVLQTSGLEGGYVTMSAFVEAAVVHELERLAITHNDGVPFEANNRGFRTGRPIGS